MAERSKLQLKNSPSRCPYCHDSLTDPLDLIACAACGARHHKECYNEHSSCASCGAQDRLVPEPQSQYPSVEQCLAELPEGSINATQKADGTIALDWNLIPENQRWKTFLLAVLTIPCFGLGLYLLFWLLVNRNNRVLLTLENNRVTLERPGNFREKLSLEASRDELELSHELEPVCSGVNVWIDGKRYFLVGESGVGHVLRETETQWLRKILKAWKHKGSGTGSAKQKDKGGQKQDKSDK